MTAKGCRPDAVAYNMLLDVLWAAGMEILQARAIALGQGAMQQGFFRCQGANMWLGALHVAGCLACGWALLFHGLLL